MATRQTALFACLFSMAFSAHADNYTCSRLVGTRPVAIASFSFTPEQLREAAKAHSPETCPIPVPSRRVDTTAPANTTAAQRLQRPASDANALQAARLPPPPDTGAPVNMCGVVDGKHYHNATALIFNYCTAQAQDKSAKTVGTAAAKARPRSRGIGFKVTQPASYNAKDHHASYDFKDGTVVGVCYVCVADIAIGVSQDINAMAVPNAAPVRPKDAQVTPRDTATKPKD